MLFFLKDIKHWKELSREYVNVQNIKLGIGRLNLQKDFSLGKEVTQGEFIISGFGPDDIPYYAYKTLFIQILSPTPHQTDCHFFCPSFAFYLKYDF